MFLLVTVLCIYVLAGVCAGAQPCSQLSDIIGDFYHFCQTDRYVMELRKDIAGWDQGVEEWIDAFNANTGVDVLNSTQREEFICTVLSLDSLRQLYDLLDVGAPYHEICTGYMNMQQQVLNKSESDLNHQEIKKCYYIAQRLSEWMHELHFPEFQLHSHEHPPVSHKERVRKLKKTLQLVDGSTTAHYCMREMLGDINAVYPLTPEAPTPDELVTSIEESWTYYGHVDRMLWFYNETQIPVARFKTDYDKIMLVKYRYDKILWYKKVVKILMRSNLFSLDTSDCPDSSEDNEIH